MGRPTTMIELNEMTVDELSCILDGLVEAGHGDSPVRICLDNGDENRDRLYDLGIDTISITNMFGDFDVSLNAYLFNHQIAELLERFEYRG